MNKPRRSQGGFVLYLAVIISLLTMLWAVAAVSRVQHQTGATLHSYRRSEVYFLAKQAASRALALMNANPDWLRVHRSRDNGDTTTPGTTAWIEDNGSRLTLVVDAELAGKAHTLKVPILRQDDPSTKLFSLSPSLNGPDVISWATTLAGDWQGLPPLPGSSTLRSVSVTDSGDVYALAEGPDSNLLWRYRTGQGWLQMPDLPENVRLDDISCGGDTQLVGKGSDNTLMVLPLGDTPGVAMAWESVPAPAGVTLDLVKAHPKGTPETFVTGTQPSGPSLWLYDGERWDRQALPRDVSNLSGGMTMDRDGNLYVATNPTPATRPATIYQRPPRSSGSSPDEWTALAPVPAIEWVGDTPRAPKGNITRIESIEADPKDGSLWVQWNDPLGTNKHNLVQFPTR